MKTVLLILFLLFIQLSGFGQSMSITPIENSIQNKVIVLIILAVTSIHNFIKWTNENNRTEP